MARFYLSADNSPIAGYLQAYIDMRSPNSISTGCTAFTNVTAAAQDSMTLTCGGLTAKWITPQFKEAVTLNHVGLWNLFGSETIGAVDATFGLELAEYTSSAQAAFVDTCYGSELGTTIEHRQHSINTLNKTIAAGSRLIITPTINAAVTSGVMAAGGGVTFQFNGLDGTCFNAYLDVGEIVLADDAQIGGGAAPGMKGMSVSFWRDQVNNANLMIGLGLEEDTTIRALKEEASNQADLN